ncbi:MAG: tyrosine-type recombinase/integrase [Deltaproteobacteria bacterium]|nr:tyrosine-type recombinase/integrase [Deltaproteobacteria bacterium]
MRDKSVRVYVGSFASKREAEFADQEHRVTQRGIRAGDLPPAVDHKRTLGDALDGWLRAIKDQRSHDEYADRMRLYVRPTFDRTPVVKITKAKLVELRMDLRDRDEPLSPATVNGVFATLSAAFNYFIEQGWCSDNPTKFIKPLEVVQHPFLWLQSAGEVQKLLSECNDNIRTLVAVLVGTGMRLDEALHLMWTDVDLQHRVIHVHRGRRGAPKSGRLRHVPIFDSVLTVLREMKLAKGANTLLWPGAKRSPDSSSRPGGHLQALQDPRPLQRRDHPAGLRAPSPGRLRRRLQPRLVCDARDERRRGGVASAAALQRERRVGLRSTGAVQSMGMDCVGSAVHSAAAPMRLRLSTNVYRTLPCDAPERNEPNRLVLPRHTRPGKRRGHRNVRIPWPCRKALDFARSESQRLSRGSVEKGSSETDPAVRRGDKEAHDRPRPIRCIALERAHAVEPWKAPARSERAPADRLVFP